MSDVSVFDTQKLALRFRALNSGGLSGRIRNPPGISPPEIRLSQNDDGDRRRTGFLADIAVYRPGKMSSSSYQADDQSWRIIPQR